MDVRRRRPVDRAVAADHVRERAGRCPPGGGAGLGVGPGRATGRVRILESPKQGKQLLDGEVLVARMTSPDWAPTLRRAGAIVTDAGGSTCHAAIVSREFGIPGVVGTGSATTDLSNGQLVTVDAASGQVFDGAVADAAPALVQVVQATSRAVEPLATKVYVNLAVAERAAEVAALPVDGVGLLRGEFLVTQALGGTHPRALIAEGRGQEFVDQMVSGLTTIAAAFHPAPGRLPHDGLPHQRVPQSRRRRSVRATRREPDDRLPWLLQVHPRP